MAVDISYRMASVDGDLPTRPFGDAVTVVQLVIVSPGVHTFFLKSDNASHPDPAISATVAADKAYRIAPAGEGNVALVEDTR